MYKSTLKLVALTIGFGMITSSHVLAQDASEVPPKEPGVQRIGVVMGDDAQSVAQDLVGLLEGDGSLVDVIALDSPAGIEIYWRNEAKKKECDYILQADFAVKQKKGFLSKVGSAADVISEINQESDSFNNSEERIDGADRKAQSLENLSNKLGSEPKDKVDISYKLYPVGAAQPALANETTIRGREVQDFLEGFVNDVLTKILL